MITLQEPVVQIRFVSDEGFADAINLSLADHAALKDGDIEAIAQQRLAGWKTFVAEQSTKPTVEPTADELTAQLAQIAEDRAQLDILKAELTDKLNSAPAEVMDMRV